MKSMLQRMCMVALALAGMGCMAVEIPNVSVGTFTRVRENFSWHGEKGTVKSWTLAFEDGVRKCLGRNGLVPAVNSVSGFSVEGCVDFGENVPLQVSVAYRVVDSAKKRVAWTDVVQIDTTSFAVTNMADLVTVTADTAARTVADRMSVNILPHRVQGRAADGRFDVGGGFGQLSIGECLTVFAAGDNAEAVGTVQIVAVSGKSAKAVLVDGDPRRILTGMCLRRVPLAKIY